MRPPVTVRWAVALAGAVAVAFLAARGLGGGGGGPATPAVAPPATATVNRATLTQTERVAGTLGYGRLHTVSARGSRGTVTWLPDLGSIVSRGRPMYTVDNQPVTLLYGRLPAYRALGAGSSGPDVEQLERNLAALGYRGFTVDSRFTSSTVDAVRRWQTDRGLRGTGTVGVDEVVIAPGPVRVALWLVAPGDPAAGPILGYTGTTRVVSIDLEVGRQSLVQVGLPITVTLPDGGTVPGTVQAIGTVATIRAPAGDATMDRAGPATIEVTVTLPDQAALGTLDSAPVEVALVAARADDVLCVPVAALVALTGGGYGVQVVDGATIRVVPVTLGMFAGGRVEVSGPGIAEGAVVVVPA